MIYEFIRKIWWWVPTKEEQYQYRRDFVNECKNEIPEIQKKLSLCQERRNLLENELLQSFSESQYNNWLKLKSEAQNEVFLQTRLNHHLEQQTRDIVKELYPSPQAPIKS